MYTQNKSRLFCHTCFTMDSLCGAERPLSGKELPPLSAKSRHLTTHWSYDKADIPDLKFPPNLSGSEIRIGENLFTLRTLCFGALARGLVDKLGVIASIHGVGLSRVSDMEV